MVPQDDAAADVAVRAVGVRDRRPGQRLLQTLAREHRLGPEQLAVLPLQLVVPRPELAELDLALGVARLDLGEARAQYDRVLGQPGRGRRTVRGGHARAGSWGRRWRGAGRNRCGCPGSTAAIRATNARSDGSANQYSQRGRTVELSGHSGVGTGVVERGAGSLGPTACHAGRAALRYSRQVQKQDSSEVNTSHLYIILVRYRKQE